MTAIVLVLILASVALFLSILNLINNLLMRIDIYEYRRIVEESMRSDASAIAFLSTMIAERETGLSRQHLSDYDSEDAQYK